MDVEEWELEQSCGSLSPDGSCGECPDCSEALDEWREMNGGDE